MLLVKKENQSLLKEMVRTDFKLRYQSSVLGYVWSLLKPLLLFTVLYLVFTKLLRFGGSPIALLLGIVMWNFFVEATMTSAGAIVSKGDLIRKIKIPKYLIILSSTVSAFINLLLGLVVVFVFIILFGSGLSWSALLLPLVIAQVYVFALGVSYFLSALFVRFRDVIYIWEVVLQMGFFLTPILYPVSLLVETVGKGVVLKLMMLNPMAQMIQDARVLLIDPAIVQTYDVMNSPWYFIPIATVILSIILGWAYFKKQSPDFAENI